LGPQNPFTFALYGGSNSPGFLAAMSGQTDTPAHRTAFFPALSAAASLAA
jgi:hypothetical protein